MKGPTAHGRKAGIDPPEQATTVARGDLPDATFEREPIEADGASVRDNRATDDDTRCGPAQDASGKGQAGGTATAMSIPVTDNLLAPLPPKLPGPKLVTLIIRPLGPAPLPRLPHKPPPVREKKNRPVPVDT